MALATLWRLTTIALFLFLVVGYVKIYGSNRAQFLRYTTAGVIGLSFLHSIVLTYFQYVTWLREAPSVYLLPPYQPISYFLTYSFNHFFLPFFLSFLFAGCIALLLLVMGQVRPQILEKGELGLYISCCVLIEWPLVIPYTAAIFLVHAVYLMLAGLIKGHQRAVLGPSLLLSALPFLLFGQMIQELWR